MDTVFVVISMIIVFALQLLVCFKSKSRTARLMPATICLAASSIWAIGLCFFPTLDFLAVLVISFYAIIFALSCGLAWAVYGIMRLIKKGTKTNDDADALKVDEEPLSNDKKKSVRKIVIAIFQILYILLVFAFTTTTYVSLTGKLVITLILVLESISIIFLAKCCFEGMASLIQKKQFLRLGASAILILSIVLFVWTSIVIYFRYADNNFAIDITDENREKIASLIATRYEDDFPDLRLATKIEHIYGFLDDDIKIYYEDGSTHTIWANGCIPQLEEYIYDEGYNIYLSGPEFTRDCIVVAVCLATTVILAAALVVICKKRRDAEPSRKIAEEPAST